MHIGSLFNEFACEELVNEINDTSADALIITGDVTDEGIITQFESAKRYIDRMDCNNKIILPGNHDYRHTGYLLFKKFFPSNPIYEIGGAVIISLGTARPDRDEGEVGHRQILWMEQKLREYNEKKKIVAMHHHLIGIPDTGTDKIIILDAGDTLRSCIEGDVDLVLCGHKHRPWLWKLGSLEIAYAGTSCSYRFRGFFRNSYNIIKIGNKIEVDLKIVGGEKFPLSQLVQSHKPFIES